MSSDNSSLPRVEHRSQRDSWHTPDTILTPVIAFNDGQPIGIDPCSDEMNPTGASSFFTAETNGLERSWAGRGLCFANVPYGDVGPWVTKIVVRPSSARRSWNQR